MTELEKATSVYVDKKRLKFWNDARKSGCLVFPEFVCSDNDLEQAFKAGAEWQYEQFEKERLKHCDELTAEQAQIESDFVVQHLKKCNRTPTFIDAIEYGRESMREKLIKLKKLADNMYYAAQYLTTDASKLHEAMKQYRYFTIYELKEE